MYKKQFYDTRKRNKIQYNPSLITLFYVLTYIMHIMHRTMHVYCSASETKQIYVINLYKIKPVHH